MSLGRNIFFRVFAPIFSCGRWPLWPIQPFIGCEIYVFGNLWALEIRLPRTTWLLSRPGLRPRRPCRDRLLLRREVARQPVGVLHAAGGGDTGLAAGIAPWRVGQLCTPKAAAARHVHRATACAPLEARALFSSQRATAGAASAAGVRRARGERPRNMVGAAFVLT